jgi:tetratricopeptide (TPR) repeat protein
MIAAEHALSGRDFSQALQILDPAVKLHPADYRLWTLQGMAFAGVHDAGSAMKAYRAALAVRADYLPALEGAAQIEFQRNSADAAALLERLANLIPGDPTTNAMLGVLAYRAGDCEKAVDRFKLGAAATDSQLAALSDYGYCLARLERFDEAEGILKRAVSLDKSSHSRYNLALIQWKAKRYDDAIATLVLELGSDDPGEYVLTLAAAIYESKNDTPRAVELLRKAILLHPQESEAYLAFATISNDHGSYQVGIDMLDAGVSRMPEQASLFMARGVLHAQGGELDKAIDDFQSANKLDPHLSFAATAEGIAQTQKHDSAKALATFREEARLHPENAFNQYMIAETISQMGANEDSALYAEELKAAHKAVKLDSHLAVAHNLLAGAYLQAGKLAPAMEESRAVLAFDANNQEALYHLILALKKAERTEELATLTSRLIKLRNADKDARSHLVHYELVEAAATQSP